MTRAGSNLELELLERELEAHGARVLRLLRDAVEAFGTGDEAAGGRAADREPALRAAHGRIDAAASRLLTDSWDVPSETRRAVAARRVNDELWGVAELSIAIARLARPAPLTLAVTELDELALAAESCVRGAMDALVEHKPGMAALLAASGILLDEAMRDAGSAVLVRAPLEPGGHEWALRAMLTARCLGGISQHGLRIAGQAGFVATGREPPGPAEAECRAS